MAAEGVPLPDEPGLPGAADPYPARLTVTLEKVETLRYGENPHQPAARYRRPGRRRRRPLRDRLAPLQGKALSYNNVRDGSAAAGLARLLRGPACVIVKHTNPCGAAERETLAAAWADALAADPVSAFGGRRRPDRPVDREVAERRAAIFLEVVVAPGVRAGGARGARGEAQPPPRGRPGAGRRRAASVDPTDRLAPHRRRGGAVTARTPPPTIRPPGRRHPTGPTMASGATWTSPGASSAA